MKGFMKKPNKNFIRFKTGTNLDYYNGDFPCIHAKFGDFRKGYYFPQSFREQYPNFCKEFDKYWRYKESVFTDPIQIVNYIEKFAIPCILYENAYDLEFADFDEVRKWICYKRHVHYNFGEGKQWYVFMLI
jgi:hypothetical protein